MYLGDVVVFGKTVSESISRLQEVLTRFRGAGLKLKPSKCNRFQTKVHYLGHVVSAGGVQRSNRGLAYASYQDPSVVFWGWYNNKGALGKGFLV